MKRVGVLMLAAVPVVLAATAYGSSPTAHDDPRPGPPSAATQRRAAVGLAAPAMKNLSQELVASAENSTLDWRSAYAYIQDIGDGQGYTAGIIGFCTGTHDLLVLVEHYTAAHPDNGLARFIPALRKVDGTDSHQGLDPGFQTAWRAEAKVPAFQAAQDAERDRIYFDPSVSTARRDGLGPLGQFIYYDAIVFHGPGTDGFYGIRERAMRLAKTPAEGGSEKAYLSAFLDIRRATMRAKHPGIDTSRIDTAQRKFLEEGNRELRTPLVWKVYGETYKVP